MMRGKLFVAYFLLHELLHLVAVLLGLLLTLLYRNVVALQTILHDADRSHSLLFGLITDLPGHLLAVLEVAVPLGLLGAVPNLHLADLLWLEVAVLPLHGLREGVGELLAVAGSVGAAHLLTDLGKKK